MRRHVFIVAIGLCGCAASASTAPPVPVPPRSPAQVKVGQSIADVIGWTREVPDAGWIPIPFGVASPSLDVGYVASSGGGTTAFRLADGEPIWTSGEAYHPVIVAGDSVIAAARIPGSHSALRLVGLSADDGEVVFRSEVVVLPEWVEDEPDYGCGDHDWGPTGASVSAGVLAVAWRAVNRVAGGAGYVIDSDASWILEVDLETGTVRVEEAKDQGSLVHHVFETDPVVVGDMALYTVLDLDGAGTRTLVGRDEAGGDPIWKMRLPDPPPDKLCPP